MSEIQKISVALTTEQLNAIKAAVDTGEYATTSEIMREALREWDYKLILPSKGYKCAVKLLISIALCWFANNPNLN